MTTDSPKELSSEVVQSAIKDLYGITSIKSPNEIGEGIENAVWIYYTGNQDFIVKIFSYSKTINDDVHEEVLLYNYLLQHGIHVPEVMPTVTGNNVSLISNTYPAILMKYENLKRISASDLTTHQLHKIATTIAHMHKVLIDYGRKEHIRMTVHDAMSIYNHSLRDFDEIFLISPNAKSPYLKDHERLREIRTDAINYLKNQKLEEELTKSVLHNDLGLGHILFREDGEIYIYDFSDFEYGAVALDLGVLFFNFYREGQLTIEQWKNTIEKFLSVYTETIDLTENDKKAIQIFTISRMLEHIRYLDRMSIKEGHPMDDMGVRKRYDLLEQLYLS
jgi:Ser/Thr protein kinase RdoA (MazF antagonist)